MTDKKLNLKEIIEMAIQVETTGAAFYRRLRELAHSEETRDFFGKLEKAEYTHIEDFQKILDIALARHNHYQYATTAEDLLYLRAVASRRVFTDPDHAVSKAEELEDLAEAVDLALDFELRSVSFYQELGQMIEDPSDRTSVEEMEREERDHVSSLYRMKEQLTNG